MPGKRLTVAFCLTVAALALGSTGAAGPGPSPAASAQAFAIKVTVPGQPDVSTAIVQAPPDGSALKDSFSSTGVAAGPIAAGASVKPDATTVATASSDVAALSLFGGEITADGVSGRAKASAAADGAAGDLAGSGVTNLVVLGQKVEPSANLRIQLADWGYLTVLEQGVDLSAPDGARGYRSFVTALDVHLNAAHGGLPAGADVLVGYAEAAAQTAAPPPSTSTTTTTGTTTTSPPKGTTTERPGKARPPAKKHKHHKKKPAGPQPPKVTPKLTAGGYVFPVYGNSSYVDTFGAARGDIVSGWHHGADIFGQLGQPVLAVADGTVYSVGYQKIGGNRLWLRDGQGNQFYYAHLAAYSTLVTDGAQVKAGDVIGFMGHTGDAQTTPYHLHFEIHPVSLLFRGYDGAVDPTTYLDAWRKLQDVQFPSAAGWAPPVPGGALAPEPGAILLQVSDISQATGLDAASLRRAYAAPPASAK